MAKKKRRQPSTNGEINRALRAGLRAGGVSAKEARDVAKRSMVPKPRKKK